LHLVDGTSGDVAGDWRTIIDELEAYGGDLANRPRVTALNKIDALDEDERGAAKAALEAAVGGPVLAMSGVSREGLVDVLRALRAEIAEDKLRHRKAAEPEPETWHP
jgi:GTP-binding protein